MKTFVIDGLDIVRGKVEVELRVLFWTAVVCERF
jgi:hypothetical protein